MCIYENLAKHVENNCIVVLPDDEAVRSFLEYLITEGLRTAVSMDRVISFDQFWNSCFPERRCLQKADTALRLLFVGELIASNPDKLRYFIPADSNEDFKHAVIPFIVGLLPRLQETEDIECICSAELQNLLDEYEKFLEKNGRYESSYHSDSFSLPSDCKYLFAFIEADPILTERYNWIHEKLDNSDRIELFNEIPYFPHDTELKVYENERQEIRSVFLQIADDLDTLKGACPSNQICITVPSLDTLRPYLEKESYLFGIPLCFKGGRAFESTPAFRFISSLCGLYRKGFDSIDVRDFVLEPSFPIADREESGKIVARAIDCSQRNMEQSDMGLFYLARSLYELSEPKELGVILDNIEKEILLDNQDESLWPAAFNDSWKELRRMASQFVLEISDSGYDSVPSVIEIFLESIRSRQVTDKTQGIPVYSWPASSYLHYRKNYILSLSEDRARIEWKRASFLADYEIITNKESVSHDCTVDALACSLCTSDECIFSVSKDTYEGRTLPLSVFSKLDKIKKPDFSMDPYQMFSSPSDDLPLPSVLVEGHKNRIHPRLITNKDAFANFKMPKDHEYSYSQIDQYGECPYSYILKRVFGLDKSGNYEIEDNFSPEIGTRIHKVIELFFKMVRADTGVSLETWKSRSSGIVDDLLYGQLEDWKKRRSAEGRTMKPDVPNLTAEMESYIWKTYRNGIVFAINEYLKPGLCWENELEIHGSIEGLPIVSYIDMVALDKQNKAATIVDWKTGNDVSGSLQFNVYKRMLESDEKYEGYDFNTKYCYIRKSQISDFNTKKKNNKDNEYRDEKLDRLISEIKSSDWNARKSSSCSKCEFKSICRNEYEGDDEDEE